MIRDTTQEIVLETKGSSNNKSNKKRHHAHTAKNDEPTMKRIREERVNSSSDEEHVL